MKRSLFLPAGTAALAVMILSGGCADRTTSGYKPRDYSGDLTISGQGVGPAKPGRSISSLQGELGPDYLVEKSRRPASAPGEWTVSSREGEELYTLGTAGNRITAIRVQSPRFHTAAGIGPGSEMWDVAAAYGPVTFSRSGAKETIALARAPEGIVFVFSKPDGKSTGEYQPGSDTTQRWQDGATVESIAIMAPR